MKRFLPLLYICVLAGACKKETQPHFEELVSSYVYKITPDERLDTAIVDSLRYLDENLHWVKVVRPELPWRQQVKSWDGADTAAMRVYGVAYAASVLGGLDLEIVYDVTSQRPGTSRGISGTELEVVYPAGDSLRFTKLLEVSLDF